MVDFIADASATVPWCIKDEQTEWSMGLLRRLDEGDGLLVPAHWPTEVSNALLVAERKGRIPSGRTLLFWDELAVLPTEIAPPLTPGQAKEVYGLAVRHTLTIYDAAYLELAQRSGLALATLDAALLRAATRDGVALVRQT